MNSGQITGISIVFILFVLAPLAASLGRLMWRRSSKPALPPGWYDAAQRMERLEQAVDTIAIEMERVSEGQRFMTKIITQNGSAAAAVNGAAAAVNGGQPLPALGPGAPPDPIVVQNQRDEVRVSRRAVQVLVAVGPLAGQRDEGLAGLDPARVYGASADRPIARTEEAAARHARDVGGREGRPGDPPRGRDSGSLTLGSVA